MLLELNNIRSARNLNLTPVNHNRDGNKNWLSLFNEIKEYLNVGSKLLRLTFLNALYLSPTRMKYSPIRILFFSITNMHISRYLQISFILY